MMSTTRGTADDNSERLATRLSRIPVPLVEGGSGQLGQRRRGRPIVLDGKCVIELTTGGIDNVGVWIVRRILLGQQSGFLGSAVAHLDCTAGARTAGLRASPSSGSIQRKPMKITLHGTACDDPAQGRPTQAVPRQHPGLRPRRGRQEAAPRRSPGDQPAVAPNQTPEDRQGAAPNLRHPSVEAAAPSPRRRPGGADRVEEVLGRAAGHPEWGHRTVEVGVAPLPLLRNRNHRWPTRERYPRHQPWRRSHQAVTYRPAWPPL